MTEDTIRGMRKTELIDLFEETADKIREIDQVHDKVLEMKRILNEYNVLEKIEDVKNQCIGKLSKIQEVEREICGDGEDNESAKERIDRVIEDGDQCIEYFEELKNEMLGYTEKNEQDEEIEGNPRKRSSRTMYPVMHYTFAVRSADFFHFGSLVCFV